MDRLIEDSVRKACPLTLTARDQSILAALCEIVGELVRDGEWRREPDAVKVVERLQEAAWTFDVTAVEFGKLYEKLHRTGANA